MDILGSSMDILEISMDILGSSMDILGSSMDILEISMDILESIINIVSTFVTPKLPIQMSYEVSFFICFIRTMLTRISHFTLCYNIFLNPLLNRIEQRLVFSQFGLLIPSTRTTF
jgi:hypothetical protein